MFEFAPPALVRGVMGGRIRTMREERGLTQWQLAEQLDVEQPWVSRVESGQIGLNPEQLRTICLVLRVSSDFLLML
jgi:transcriptional regulator with XRE-family HTH domain